MGTGGIVNIKAGPYYITFNLKTGFNWEIDEEGVDEDYTNQIIIHEGLDIPFRQTLSYSYFDTILVASLANVFDVVALPMPQGDVVIQLCEIDTSEESGGATLSIGLDTYGCHLDRGTISNPPGIQNMLIGVPVPLFGFRNELFEFVIDVSSISEPVTCSTWGGNGDIDLFLDFGSVPQISFVEGSTMVRRLLW